MVVDKPSYEILYNGKNITGDILPYCLSFTYTDKSEGESDEIELQLEDSRFLWRLDWYPVKGDKITARIFKRGNTLECGTFVIDEIQIAGSRGGDTVSMRALAAGTNKKLRTKTSSAHENKTLKEIANTIAQKYGLTVQGAIADVRLNRFHTFRETDLSALKRLSNEFGYTFAIRDTKMIFTNIFELENKQSALTISRKEITSFSITDKTAHTFKAANVVYHDPRKKKVTKNTQAEKNDTYKTVKPDTLEVRVKAENAQQAELKAKVSLYHANSLQQEGSIDMPGNVLALAGNNCELVGFGVCSGKFYIKTSTHAVSRDGGYTTSLEIKRVGLVDKSKQSNNYTDDTDE